jgi:hypothetical protein
MRFLTVLLIAIVGCSTSNQYGCFGYDNYVRNATSIQGQRRFSGFAAGVGIRTAYVQIDYGVTAIGTAGSIHRLTLNTSL